MALTYYLSDRSRQLEIPHDAAVEGSLERVLDELAELSPMRGNFLGINVGASSVQFYCEGAGAWSIDVPVPAKRGSLIRSARFEDLESYVRAVFSGTNPVDLPGLAFEAF